MSNLLYALFLYLIAKATKENAASKVPRELIKAIPLMTFVESRAFIFSIDSNQINGGIVDSNTIENPVNINKEITSFEALHIMKEEIANNAGETKAP